MLTEPSKSVGFTSSGIVVLSLGWAGRSLFFSVESFGVVACAVAAAGEATPGTAAVVEGASCSLIPGAPALASYCLASALDPLAPAGIDDVGEMVDAGAVVSSGVSDVTLMFISWETGRGAAGALVADGGFGGEAAMLVARGELHVVVVPNTSDNGTESGSVFGYERGPKRPSLSSLGVRLIVRFWQEREDRLWGSRGY